MNRPLMRASIIAATALTPIACLAKSNNIEEAMVKGLFGGVLLGACALLIAFVKKRFADAASVSAPKSALAKAAANGQLAQVVTLIGAGIDVNDQDDRGGTALMLAARNNRLPVVQYLLEQGAKVDLKTKSGFSALDIAVKHACSEIVDAIALRGLK